MAAVAFDNYCQRLQSFSPLLLPAFLEELWWPFRPFQVALTRLSVCCGRSPMLARWLHSPSRQDLSYAQLMILPRLDTHQHSLRCCSPKPLAGK
ncbi:uncharacterized protein P884DRAFT_258914 [Thermothelomyces heterothallicus CBS 202.75]|uniref:uncharacterized protein n=1 Tax=Thermothelomyces heterothallicus CBS 202.75 TaxID=1149848 RepID=UPI003742F036